MTRLRSLFSKGKPSIEISELEQPSANHRALKVTQDDVFVRAGVIKSITGDDVSVYAGLGNDRAIDASVSIKDTSQLLTEEQQVALATNLAKLVLTTFEGGDN